MLTKNKILAVLCVLAFQISGVAVAQGAEKFAPSAEMQERASAVEIEGTAKAETHENHM